MSSLAVGDVNGDSLDDVFIGGAAGVAGKMFTQHKDGRFAESSGAQPWLADNKYEDWGALFFDANGDKQLDLYVASGGYHLAPNSPLLQDRLYINQGGGRFARDAQALPAMPTSTATVQAGDFTGDGRPDLCVGGRLTPRNYPHPTRSYLLRNDGGRLTDVTEAVAPSWRVPVHDNDCGWIDFDGMSAWTWLPAGEGCPSSSIANDGKRLTRESSTRAAAVARAGGLALRRRLR